MCILDIGPPKCNSSIVDVALKLPTPYPRFCAEDQAAHILVAHWLLRAGILNITWHLPVRFDARHWVVFRCRGTYPFYSTRLVPSGTNHRSAINPPRIRGNSNFPHCPKATSNSFVRWFQIRSIRWKSFIPEYILSYNCTPQAPYICNPYQAYIAASPDTPDNDLLLLFQQPFAVIFPFLPLLAAIAIYCCPKLLRLLGFTLPTFLGRRLHHTVKVCNLSTHFFIWSVWGRV